MVFIPSCSKAMFTQLKNSFSANSFVFSILIAIFLCIVSYFCFSGKNTKNDILEGNYQVVVIVNKDLGMTKGKVLSQFGHAIDSMHEYLKDHPKLVLAWRNCGSAKIALKGTQIELNRIYNDCIQKGLLCDRIYDAGKTQIRSGSNTIVVVGPATKKQLEHITGHLRLY